MIEIFYRFATRNDIKTILVVCPHIKFIRETLHRFNKDFSNTFNNAIYAGKVLDRNRITFCGKILIFISESEMTDQYLRGLSCYDVVRIDRLPVEED